eukprot:355264_1
MSINTLKTYCFFIIGIDIICCEDFGWQKKEDVAIWYDNLALQLSKWYNETEITTANTQAFVQSIDMGKEFEDYVFDMAIFGRDEWIQVAVDFNLGKYATSMQAFYDIKYWHARHALVEYFYLYQFVDGTQLFAKGEITHVWNKNGE